ncbi:hypothetical protein JI664_17930 [Rhodobacter sp. NTK016B]|uniref:hypothetical protein n=1 Tax=Rhodobacter sp. NTK016B TaxID=2759676 RepID=UPI001A90B837|nr:hypothetical protein [Rhodobacter sp. NTK016B]MBN8293855.1 hypothetical protein [Rhodobacter sp. NTK016B]
MAVRPERRALFLKALPFLTGAALAAALVLTAVATVQTLSLMRARPAGTRVEASVLTVDLRPPTQTEPWYEGRVRLFISDRHLGTFTIATDHPPVSVTEIWPGATVDVAVTQGNPPRVAYWPTGPEHRNRVTLIALALTLLLAAVSGLATRILRPA